MKRRHIAFLALALLLVTIQAGAQIDRSKKPAPGPAPKAAFPDFTETTLSNGLKVLVVTNTAEPLVTFRLMIKSGSSFESKSGIASFTTDLLTKGTKSRSSLAFAKESENLGIGIGAGATDDAITVGASGLKKHTEKILELMTDALMNPIFPEDELDKSRKQTLSGLVSQKKDPDAISSRLQIMVGFNAHPYAHFETESSVKSITRDDLVSFHKAHFIPNNSSIAIVGDVTAKEIIPIIEKYFKNWKKGDVPKADFPAVKPVSGRTVHLVDLGTTQTQTALTVMTSGVPRNNPDYFVVNLANSILGGGMSGRLFQNLREKHGFTYGCYGSLDSRREAGVWMASADVRRIATDSAAAEIIREMKRMQDEPVPADELEMHKQYASGRFLLSLENPETTTLRVQDIDLYNLPKDYYKTYVTRLMKLTAADLQRVAKLYFNTDNFAVTAAGDASVIKAGLEKIGPVQMYDTDMNPVKASVEMKVDIDAETLLKKHVDAIGGAAHVAAIKDRTSEFSVSMNFGPQAIEGTMLRIEKAPNLQYEKNTFMVDMGGGEQPMEQEQWVDGTHASMSVPMQPQAKEMEGEDLTRMLEDSEFNALPRWKELGYEPTITAKRTMDGKLVYVLNMKKKHGSVTYYFTADDYLLYGEDAMREGEGGGPTLVAMRYFDYKQADGVMLPYRVTMDAGQMSMEMKLKSVKQNTGVDNSVFKRK